jgi:hypothetical protein
MQELNLRKFDMSSIPDDNVIVMIGKRNTGKSFLVKDLLYYKQGLPAGTVISGTEGANEFYSNIVPPIFIHEEFKPDIVNNLLKRQRGLINKMKEGEQFDPRVFFIMDDCMYDHSWTKDKGIRQLFMNGRHWKILYIITMQYPLGIPPNLRTNIDYVFILRENLYANRKRIYEQYAGMFPTFESFCQIMDQCTEDYECLVIHNNSKSNKLEDQVFWYKADSHPDFRIGNDKLWRFNNQHLNNRGMNGNNIVQFDPSSFHTSRRTPSILVKKNEF